LTESVVSWFFFLKLFSPFLERPKEKPENPSSASQFVVGVRPFSGLALDPASIPGDVWGPPFCPTRPSFRARFQVFSLRYSVFKHGRPAVSLFLRSGFNSSLQRTEFSRGGLSPLFPVQEIFEPRRTLQKGVSSPLFLFLMHPILTQSFCSSLSCPSYFYTTQGVLAQDWGPQDLPGVKAFFLVPFLSSRLVL